MTNNTQHMRSLITLCEQILAETPQDDLWISNAAEQTAKDLINNRARLVDYPVRSISYTIKPHDVDTQYLSQIRVFVSKYLERENPQSQGMAWRASWQKSDASQQPKFVLPYIEIPYGKFMNGDLDNDLATIIAHELRHALDFIKHRREKDFTMARPIKYMRPTIPSEYNSSPVELNARFQELIAMVFNELAVDIAAKKTITNSRKQELIDYYVDWLFLDTYFPQGRKSPGFRKLISRAYKAIDYLIATS